MNIYKSSYISKPVNKSLNILLSIYFIYGLNRGIGHSEIQKNYGISAHEEILDVDVGKIRCGNGKMKSLGFGDCTAVILDFGNEALMAHALPEEYKYYEYYSFDYFMLSDFFGPKRIDFHTQIYSFNVVDRLIKEAKRKNLDIDHAEAILDAGRPDLYLAILMDLHKNNIKIRKAQCHMPTEENFYYPKRDIYYNPKTDNLEVITLHR